MYKIKKGNKKLWESLVSQQENSEELLERFRTRKIKSSRLKIVLSRRKIKKIDF